MQQTIHFIGIGGVGMSALAQAFLDRGARVTGSDRLLSTGHMTPTLATLQAQGVQLYPQDGSAITPESTVVYSTAIEADNPDFAVLPETVRRLHRAEALQKIILESSFSTSIAVSGSCGKSFET